MTLTIILVWWAFGAGFAACEYHLVIKQFNRPIGLIILASLATCIMGPFSLAFDSTTCIDCGELVRLKVFGRKIYENERHNT